MKLQVRLKVEFKDYMFGTATRQMVYKSLDANTMRSRAIAQNIANVSTEGYKRVDVSFEDQVKRALQLKINGSETKMNHMSLGRDAALSKVDAKSYLPDDKTLPGDINNVDVDLENAKMAENQIQFDYNIKFAGFDKFLAAIRGSGA